MDFSKISAWSIKNPIVPIVMFTALMLAGIVAFMRMDVQQQPDIEFPMVIVTISQPGAAPTEIENQITQRIESSIRSINGIAAISSTASEGSSQTQIEFELGEDINQAVNEVKNAIDRVRGELPDGILEPQVFKANTSSQPIAYFVVEADDMTIEQLSWFIDDTIAKRLLNVEGMAEVTRNGGVNREILVTLDPPRMQAQGVTASQVNQALRGLNVNAAGGKAEIGSTRQSLRVLGNAPNAYALSQTDIPLGMGRSVKLADIARVEDKYGEITSIAKFGGKPVVTFGIARARGASDVTAYDGAIEEIAKIEKEYPGVHIKSMFTMVDYTKEQYESSMASMVEGAILAVVVVFFFLRDWRATIIAAIAIPLSAIPTFWFMELMGFSLNQLSLLALGLVAGVLVDDAIVEIENIVRHMRMGKTAYQASIDAADEIGLAVVATTFSIVAVFLPVGLMPGVSGEFFKNFGLTVVASVLMSLAVARMITPMVAAYFLKAHGEEEHAGGPLMERYLTVLHWSLDTRKAQAFRAERRRADGTLSWMNRLRARLRDHRVWMMGTGIGSLVLTVLLFGVIPMEFFPTQDNDTSAVVVDMVPGTTLAQTEAVSDQVKRILAAQPETGNVYQRISEGNSRVMAMLKDDRARTSLKFEADLTPQLQAIPDARITFQNLNSGQTGTGRPISVMLSGSDPVVLEHAAATLVEQMKGVKQVVAPRISADMRRPEVIIKPRLDLAASLGVSTQALSQAIRIATIGEIDQNAAKFSLADRQVPIRVRLPESARRDLSTITNLPVPTADGGSVPLSRVAEISLGSGPTTIQRYNQQRRIFVGADLARGVVKSEATDAINKLPVMVNLPRGVSNAPYGSDRWQADMLSSLMVAVPSGILLVFAVLVLLYHRVISPLVNMSSLFLAPLGGLLALLITGQPLSMSVFIGILMLFGIVAKNSILLIDFAIEEMKAGAGKFEAIMEAGHKRAQPIIMTTVAMTAGMLPTAIVIPGWTSGDGAWRAPMGTVVIGGLIVSTLLTLLIVPAAFSLADGLEKRLGPKLRRGILTYEPEHGEAARRKEREESALPAE
ncbi:MAG: efflux RND transporter permease subunit [Novosphingobium sp.]|nr:MAG: efflux RND transporter permease subunit [Novosphingobium sp.]